MTIRILVITFHLLVAGIFAFCALTLSTDLDPRGIIRVCCAFGALTFGYEAYTMIRDQTSSK